MKLFVGLGNPGARYAGNRHNVGFMAVEAIAAAHRFGPWRQKYEAEVAEGLLGTEKVLLVKPQTFMNLSGQSAGAAMRYLKLAPGDIWVFHDELDLAPGKIRVKSGGGHAGHNGLRSLSQHLGPDYHRVRIGIGHPGHKDLVTNYVLQDFAKSDRDWLDPLLDAIGRAAEHLALGDSAKFTSAIGLALHPAEARPGASAQPAAPNAPAPAVPEPESGRMLTALDKLLARFARR